jgi:hypothetical protein
VNAESVRAQIPFGLPVDLWGSWKLQSNRQ